MLLIYSFLIFIFISIFSSPFSQPNPVVFSGRTKIRKNNEECLILHVFNSSEHLILHVSGYSEHLLLHISVSSALRRLPDMVQKHEYIEKEPLSALLAYFPASVFSSYLFPAQKSFFREKVSKYHYLEEITF